MYGKDGQPLYSWRVLLLPCIEQDEVYNEFHLDEPWDSVHNIRLLERMPQAYAPPGSRRKLAPPGHTFCRVFVGKDTAFENPDGQDLKDFGTSQSNTILVVEGGEPVPWTKPEGLKFAPREPLPRLATVFNDGFRFALVDSSVRFMPGETSEEALSAYISRNDDKRKLPFPY